MGGENLTVNKITGVIAAICVLIIGAWLVGYLKTNLP